MFALLIAAIAVFGRLQLDPWLGDRYPFVPMYLSVLLCVRLAGSRPALLTLVAVAILSDYFLLLPRRSFKLIGLSQQGGVMLPLLLSGCILLFARWTEVSRDAYLREHAFLRSLIQSSPDMIWVKSASGVILECNPEVERLFGLTRAELIGKTNYQLSPKEEADQICERDLQALASEGPMKFETQFRYPDGTLSLKQVIKTRMRAADGTVIGVMSIARDITEMDRVLREHRQRLALQQRLEQVAANAPGAMYEWRVGPEGGVSMPYASSKFQQMFGIDPADLVEDAKLWREAVHPEDLPKVREMTERSLQSLGQWALEFRIHHPQKGFLWVAASASPSRQPDGGVLWQGYLIDITERKSAQLTLADAQSHRRALLDQSRDGIVLLFENGAVCEANESFARMLGYSLQEVEKLHLWDWHGDATQKQGLDRITELSHSGKLFESLYRRRDGSRIEVEISICTTQFQGQELYHCVVRDVTARRAAQRSLRESEDRYRSVVNSMNEGVVLQDANGAIVFFNPSATRMLTVPAIELTGKTSAGYDWQAIREDGSLFPGSEHPSMYSLETGKPKRGELMGLQRPDQSITWISINSEPMFHPGEQKPYAVVCTFTDVTEKRRVDLMLRNTVQALEVATKAKSDFLSAMSHEIRTPMNGVLGMAGLLMDTPLSLEQQEYVNTIRASGDALMVIINDILDFSKIEAGHMELERIDFDLPATVQDAVEVVLELANHKGLEVNILIDRDVPDGIWGDPGRVRQVLLNYLSNAVKFTASGEVIVHVSSKTGQGDPLLRFEVIDTGIGLTPEQAKDLFTPFHQADRSTSRRFGGTGLGLAISQKLVIMMGGTVGVQSKLDNGSTFWFTLPIETSGTIYAQPLPPDLAGSRVLVIARNDTTRQAMLQKLRRAGVNGFASPNGKAAVQIMAEALVSGDPFDLVFYDVEIAGEAGFHFARKLQAQSKRPNFPVILLISSTDQQLREEASEAGFTCLTKPLRQGPLVGAMADALGDRVVVQGPAPGSAGKTVYSGLVLVAEDNSTNQRVAQLLLERLGCRVELAANGQEAVEAASSCAYDLILMDCLMPKLDGYEATRAIRRAEAATGRHTPIIALTANALAGEGERCLEAGMDEYLSKPIHGVKLAEALRRWVGKAETETHN